MHGEKDSGHENLANDLGCHGYLGCWLRRETMSFAARRLHVAVITLRSERVRVISLRRANRRGEQVYAAEIFQST